MLDIDRLYKSLDIPTIYDFAARTEIQTGPKEGHMFDLDSSLIAKNVWPVLFPSEPPKYLYDEVIITGPSQCGKTLSVMIPVSYTIGVLAEDFIFSAPNMAVVTSKWQTDIFPIFKTHPMLRGLLTGKNKDIPPLLQSTGSYTFANRAMLRLISTQSSDRSKASFTSKNVIITEFGGISRVRSSEETDAIGQLKARTRAFGLNKRFILESTGTTDKGIVEYKYQNGTRSTIVAPCPHCKEMITPLREHFILKDNPHFICPKCKGKIFEKNRQKMFKTATMIHLNKIDAPNFSFKLPAFFNQFTDIGQFAREEYELCCITPNSVSAENKKRELLNFLWGEPYELPDMESLDISIMDQPDDTYTSKDTIKTRVPSWVTQIVLGADIQLRRHYWTLTGWGKKDGQLTGHVIDYGIYETGYDQVKDEKTKDQLVSQSLIDFITEMRRNYKIDLILTDIGYLFSSLILTANQYGKKLKWYGAHGQPTDWRAKREKYPASSEYKVIQEFEDGQIAARKRDKSIYIRHESAQERYHLLELIRIGRFQLYTPNPSETHTTYLTSLDSHFQAVDPATGEIRWEKRHQTTDHYLDSAILTLTAYKLLNPTFRFGAQSVSDMGGKAIIKSKQLNDIPEEDKPTRKYTRGGGGRILRSNRIIRR